MNLHPNQPPVPPTLAIWLGILAVSTSSIFIRFAQEEAHSLVIAASRLSLATLILAPYAFTRQWDEITRLDKSQISLVLISGIFLASRSQSG